MASSDKRRFAPFDDVVVPFPYADRQTERRRHAVVISSRRLDPYDLVWLAMITSADNEPWSCDVATPDGAGLPAPPVVRPVKIACVDPSRIARRTGRLDKATARTVSRRLRAFMQE
ncbi:type II toxin-antitoxin system PemK/MazF family toxin [Xanthobacteraceae bacterium Astr-EGSB]|uniref:type II toxin-antitoxin system PemK/MazF family toxin n=1 Tax=Astrobacterium formosum TaxID=3069710 RepID=UPI0027AE5CBC|nr:type II toxin-antitoxin system PemK/MazF family toxin [Xanthobacteraceae bacterium Astr-EGSB]